MKSRYCYNAINRSILDMSMLFSFVVVLSYLNPGSVTFHRLLIIPGVFCASITHRTVTRKDWFEEYRGRPFRGPRICHFFHGVSVHSSVQRCIYGGGNISGRTIIMQNSNRTMDMKRFQRIHVGHGIGAYTNPPNNENTRNRSNGRRRRSRIIIIR